MSRPLAVVVMAAGLGTRMRSETPKHLHPLLGKRVIDWLLDAVGELGPDRTVVVVAPGGEHVTEDVEVAVQQQSRGTGDAVASARPLLGEFDGDLLVLDGAAPLLTGELLSAFVDAHRAEAAAVTLLSIEPTRPLPYGRVLRGPDGEVLAIVEERDATPEQLAIREFNSSIYVFEAESLWPVLEQLEPTNAKGELYLTDTIRRLVTAGKRAAAWRSPDWRSPEGINTRADLAVAAAVLRDRINERHLLAGVTIVDPRTTWIEAGVELETDAVIQPFTVLRGATRVAAGAEVGPHAVAVDAEIGRGATVGPFCYLRPGTALAAGARAGTFVELKNTSVGEGAKVPHLSYLGDAEVGAGTNIGASNVTANFDHRPGQPKKRTKIGRNVRTAVDNTFVAPVEIGDDAWIAAGSVITEDVPPGSLAGFAPRQVTREGYVYEKHGKRDD